jgi:hypothetical protein
MMSSSAASIFALLAASSLISHVDAFPASDLIRGGSVFALLISHLFTLSADAYSQLPPDHNMIQNGGFENALKESNQQWSYYSDASLIAPWKFSGQQQYELDFAVWPTTEGKVSMDLSSTGPLSICQDVTTVIGNYYFISMDVNDNDKCGSKAFKRASIIATGGTNRTFGHKGGPLNEWKQVDYFFKATRKTSKITITSLEPSSCGVIVDNIKMVHLKDPSSKVGYKGRV